MLTTTDQDSLRRFIKRRHPDYAEKVGHWNFCEQTYEGGREWFLDNVFRYMKEGDREFADRLARAYRFNHTREVVDLVNKYIGKGKVERNSADAPEEITRFWDRATLSGLDINQFRDLVAKQTSMFGMVWVFTDTNKSAEIVSVDDEKKADVRVYAYTVKPQNLLDVGFATDGSINWVLVRETARDDADPILSTGAVEERFRLWTPTHWMLFQEIEAGNRGKVVVLREAGENKLGRVPGFPVTHMIGENRYSAPGLINDIAYLDRAVANYLSNLDAIIQDQTFSQLTIPGQALLPGSEAHDALAEMGTKRMFTYDGEGGAKPEYISPDVKQAEVIVEVINKIINEIYHTIGLAGERTKQDNSVGIDNSSGVAKAYDFERVNSLLTSKGHALENAENRLIEMVLAWHGKPAPQDELVKYPETYDVRSLYDEFTIAERMALIQAPDTVRRQQMRQVIDKLFPRLAKEIREKMEAELKSWPPKIVAEAGAPPSKFDAGSKRNPQTQNRQGQVTKATGTK